MKIAIFQHFIEGKGGAQKVVCKIANYLKSKGNYVEIFTQKYNEYDCYEGFKNIKINLLKPSLKILSPFVFMFKKIKDFDILISNDFPSNFISIRNKPTVWICYSPRRYFYDLKDFYINNSKFFQKMLIYLKIFLFKKIDKLSAKKSTVIFSISKEVQTRVKKYYERDSVIFTPGINFNNYYNNEYDDFFVSVSRLVNAKRVDMIIKSMGFIKNKKIKLYIIGGGEDEAKLKLLSKNYKNIYFLGEIDDKRLLKYYADCLGVIYVPIREDWGLVPIEAGASGKLTIGVNEGGLKETIDNGKTGFLIKNVTPKKIAEKLDFICENKDIAMKMGQNARNKLKAYDWNNVLSNLDFSLLDIKYPLWRNGC